MDSSETNIGVRNILYSSLRLNIVKDVIRLKKLGIVFILLFFNSMTLAQSDQYFGISAGLWTNFENGTLFTPAIHGSNKITEHFETRFSLEFPFVIVADALYTDTFSESDIRFYVGGGFDLSAFASVFGLHITAGIEYRVSQPIGIFIESQPVVFWSFVAPDGTAYVTRVRLGINIYLW